MIFLFTDNSPYTFAIALFTFVVLAISSFDFSNLKFSKIVLLYTLGQIIYGIDIVFCAYSISYISELDFLTIFGIIVFGGMVLYSLFSKKIFELKKNTPIFFFFSVGDAFLGTTIAFISLYLINNVGIVLTSLLSLMTMVTTLATGYFLLHDTPSKKDILIATFVLSMIGLGSYLNIIYAPTI